MEDSEEIVTNPHLSIFATTERWFQVELSISFICPTYFPSSFNKNMEAALQLLCTSKECSWKKTLRNVFFQR